MKKLLTWLLAILLLTAAAMAGASYWFGLQAEKIYASGLQQFAISHHLTITQQRYQRGWFTATSTTIFFDPQRKATLKIDSLLQHGPLPWRSTIDRLRTDPLAVRPVQAIVYSRLQLQQQSAPGIPIAGYSVTGNAVTRVKINADADTTFQLDKSMIQSSKGGSLRWQQVSGNVQYLQLRQQLTGQLESPKLDISGPGKTVILENIRSRFSFTLKGWRSPENFQLTADTVKMQATDSAATVLKQFFVKIQGPTTRADQALSLRAGFNTANWKQQQFGPAQFTLSSKSLEPLFSATTPPPASPSLLDTFRKYPPHIKAQLRMATDNGMLEGQLKLQLEPQKLTAISPLALFAALKADASVTLPRTLLEAAMVEKLRAEILLLQQQGKIRDLTPQQLQQILDRALPGRINALLSAKMFVQQSDGRFSSHLQIQDSKLQLNDTPLNIFELLSKFTGGGAAHGLL
ncbi:MAG TPA: DUF945 family protein [Gammaproteobacteria bacterium]|nr:DUF945 family protein [Gammaproteobacteria bacterium]